MTFRTTISPALSSEVAIDHGHRIVMMGSCFSDNIGERLRQELFDVEVNPFGTLYNPASIVEAVNRFIENKPVDSSSLFNHNGMWHSFSHHSSFSGTDHGEVLNNINHAIDRAHHALQEAQTLIVTFGTAYVYTLVETGDVVANCHKLPAARFNRRSMSVAEIVELWSEAIVRLRQFNQSIKIVFTVSPIRHLADGMHGNQLSKSTLLLAVDRLCKTFSGVAVYFPSYEIMMDDLRDYRFYASDMTHPSDVAVDYIYKLFSQAFMSDSTRAVALECARFTRRLRHRHMSNNDNLIQAFKQDTERLRKELLQKHPQLERALNNFQ